MCRLYTAACSFKYSAVINNTVTFTLRQSAYQIKYGLLLFVS